MVYSVVHLLFVLCFFRALCGESTAAEQKKIAEASFHDFHKTKKVETL
jgi:hypothetical protein